jgi:4-hydroxy-4-methyl-2-oxoglutarate aldolase
VIVCEPTGTVLLASALVASAAGDRATALTGFAAAWPEARASGPALTVRGAPDDNLALHRAIDEVGAGEVIVVDAGGSPRTGLCGDLLALAAQRRGAAGLVVNGCVRDLLGIGRLGFPVFHRGTSPVAAGKQVPGELRVPLALDGVAVQPGDLVVADVDGIVVVPAREADGVLADAEALIAKEEEFRRRIETGEATLDLLGLRRTFS